MPKTFKMMTEKEGKKEIRTEVLSFKATPKEKEIIERLAKGAGVTVSQYVRGSVIVDMLMSGDLEAMKHSLSLYGNGLRDAVRSKVFVHDESVIA